METKRAVDILGRLFSAVETLLSVFEEQLELATGETRFSSGLIVKEVFLLAQFYRVRGESALISKKVLDFYCGTNPSYNLNKLQQKGYLVQVVDPIDHRRITHSLTEKGCALGEAAAHILDGIDSQIGRLFPKDSLEQLTAWAYNIGNTVPVPSLAAHARHVPS